MRKVITTLLCFLVISLNLVPVFNAATPTFRYNLSGGVSNVYYWFDSSVNSTYQANFNSAANNWIYTGYGYNPIYMYKSSSNTSTKIDVYTESKSKVTYSGYTMFYVKNSAVNPNSSNWHWSKIMLNKYYLNSYSTAKRTGVITHEIGHALGLDHSTYISSIMYGYDSRTNTKVTKDAHDAINIKY